MVGSCPLYSLAPSHLHGFNRELDLVVRKPIPLVKHCSLTSVFAGDRKPAHGFVLRLVVLLSLVYCCFNLYLCVITNRPS